MKTIRKVIYFMGLRRLKSEAGGAEIAVVLAAAAIGVMVVTNNAGIYTKLSQANRSNNQSAVSLDFKKEIESFLANPANCTATFINQATTGGLRTNSFVDNSGAVGVQVGPNTSYGNPPVKLIGWELRDTSTIINPAERTRIVDLHLHFQKTGESPGASDLLRTVKLSTQKAGSLAGPITSCFAVSGAGTDLWVRDASGNNINNTNSGHVGIGTSSPVEKLQVVGSSRISGEMTAIDMNVTGLITSVGNVLINGNSALGHTNPTERLHLAGNSYVTGSSTLEGDLYTRDLAVAGDHQVTGNARVVRNSNFGTLIANGQADMGSTLDVAANATFNAAVTAPMIGVNGAGPNATNRLAVQGDTQVSAELQGLQMHATQFCIGGNCRTTFAQQDCPNGAIMTINADGTRVCANPNCGPNELFKGLDASGSPICDDLPMNSCGPNEYMSQVNPVTGARSCQQIPPHMNVADCAAPGRITQIRGTANGNRVCANPVYPGGACPAGQIARTIGTTGTITCTDPTTNQDCPSGKVRSLDSNGVIVCSDPFPTVPVACPAGQVSNGVNADGSLRCVATGIVGGACPGYSVAIGINANGQPTCGCLPMIVAWNNGSQAVCEGVLPPTLINSSRGISGSTSYGSGTATFYCGADGQWNTNPTTRTCN